MLSSGKTDKFAVFSTVEDEFAQDKVKEKLPDVSVGTVSVPLLDLVPDHSPEAVQVPPPELLQDSSTVSLR